MDPSLVAAACFGGGALLTAASAFAGWWARGQVADSREALLRDQVDDLERVVEDLLDASLAQRDAAELVAAADADAGEALLRPDPRERRRLLLSAGLGPDASPTATGGEAKGADGRPGGSL